MERSNSAERVLALAVVVDENVRELACGASQVAQRSRKASNELFGWNIVTAADHPLSDAGLGQLGVLEADEAKNDGVSLSGRVTQERQLFSDNFGRCCVLTGCLERLRRSDSDPGVGSSERVGRCDLRAAHFVATW